MVNYKEFAIVLKREFYLICVLFQFGILKLFIALLFGYQIKNRTADFEQILGDIFRLPPIIFYVEHISKLFNMFIYSLGTITQKIHLLHDIHYIDFIKFIDLVLYYAAIFYVELFDQNLISIIIDIFVEPLIRFLLYFSICLRDFYRLNFMFIKGTFVQ